MNDVVKIYFCFIIAVIFYMMSCCASLATTADEDIKLQSELQSICNSYKNPCVINLTSSNDIQGYTTYKGEIVLTKGLRRVLTYNEVKAVGLHEIGHHVLQHYKKQYTFIATHPIPSAKVIREFRHTNELQADAYATLYYSLRNEHNYLPEALKKLTANDELHKETMTHPSTYKRIQIIKEHQSNYERLRTSL